MGDGLIWVVLAAFLGALGSGMAGWWDSNEPFCLRKFMGTVWRAIFSGMTFALTFEATNFTGLQAYIAAGQIRGVRAMGVMDFNVSVEVAKVLAVAGGYDDVGSADGGRGCI